MGRSHARRNQQLHRLPPQRVERRDGQVGHGIDLQVAAAQHKGRVAQLLQLTADARRVGGPALRGLHELSLAGDTVHAVGNRDAHGHARLQFELAVHGEFFALGGEALLQIMHLRLGDQAVELIALPCLGEACASGCRRGHAHGQIVPASAAQHQRILAVHVLREQHLAVPIACADAYAQVVRARSVHQFRILHAEAVAPGEAAAVEHLCKLRTGLVHVKPGIVQRGAVDGGGERHVLRPLETALDL